MLCLSFSARLGSGVLISSPALVKTLAEPTISLAVREGIRKRKYSGAHSASHKGYEFV